MDPIILDFGRLIGHILNPNTFGFVTALGGSVYYMYKYFKKRLKVMHDETTDMLVEKLNEIDRKTDERLDSVEKEVLRLQLLEGMNSYRLSPSEVSFFYDRYTALGGNSFVSGRVKEYLEEYPKHNLNDGGVKHGY